MARCSSYVVEYGQGKSFNFSKYSDAVTYSNTVLKQDFVSHNGAMYVFTYKGSQRGIDPEIDTANGTKEGKYWLQIINGTPGEKGEKGDKGDSIVGPQGAPGEDGKSIELEVHDDQIWVRKEGDTEWSKTPSLTPNSVYMPTKDINGTITWRLVKNPTESFAMGSIKGDSAYTVAVQNGFEGSEEDWLRSLKGETGEKGEPGRDGQSIVGPQGRPGRDGKDGKDGREIEVGIVTDPADGSKWLAQKYEGQPDSYYEKQFSLEELRGEPGKKLVLSRDEKGNLIYWYEGEPSEAKLLVDYNDYKGETIEAVFVQDGHLYVRKTGKDVPIDAGHVVGPQGEPSPKPVFRVDRYSALTPEEKEAIKKGEERIWTGTHIQWKYDGESYRAWKNLIQINELLNIAISGAQLDYLGIGWTKQYEDKHWEFFPIECVEDPGESIEGHTLCHKVVLNMYKTYFDEENVLHIGTWEKDENTGEQVFIKEPVDTLSEIYIPIQRTLINVEINPTNNNITFTYIDPEEGKITETIDINFHPGPGINIDNETDTISINIDDEKNAQLLDGNKLLVVDEDGLKIQKLIENHLINKFELIKNEGEHKSNIYKITSEDGKERDVEVPDPFLDLELDEDAYLNDDYADITYTTWNGTTQHFTISTNNWIEL